MHSQTKDLLAIVKRGEAEEIEAARDLVRPELLPELLAAYWTLPTWDDKAGLMQLFSNHFASGGEKVMLDFLTAPITELNDEYTTSGKIVALCQLTGTFEFYERLWYNRPLCAAVIQRALAGEKPTLALVDALDKPQPQAQPAPPAKSPKWLLALCGALALALAAWGGYLLLTGQVAGGIQPPQWVSMAALILLFLLPILLTWATVVWWERSERARQQKAQQEGGGLCDPAPQSLGCALQRVWDAGYRCVALPHRAG